MNCDFPGSLVKLDNPTQSSSTISQFYLTIKIKISFENYISNVKMTLEV